MQISDAEATSRELRENYARGDFIWMSSIL